MANSKLDNFILFHLFKLPALLAVVGAVSVFVGGKLLQEAKGVEQIVNAGKSIDVGQLQHFSHFLSPNATIDDFVHRYHIQASIASTDPVKLETDPDSVLTLEEYGIVFKDASCVNSKVILTLQPYPKQSDTKP